MTTADALIRGVDSWQRRRRWAAFVVGVGRKFAEDGVARHGARVAYYAFLSIFPLLLVFVSVLGFALQDHPERRQDILDSAYADMPVIGPFIRSDIGVIGGSGLALVVGIVIALWAGLAVTLALGQALDQVWSLPPLEQPGFVSRRLRGVAVLVIGGSAIVASSVMGGAAASGRLNDAGQTAAALLGSLAIDAVIFLSAFRLLTARSSRAGELLPGVAVGAFGLLLLQVLGAWYVGAAIADAADTYGVFATVIGLMSWLTLAAQLVLIAAEVNAVRALDLYPRSLRGRLTAADRRALERYAGSALRDPRERITVRWIDDDDMADGDASTSLRRDERLRG
jgi:YihY family inner membrane protein